MLRLAPLLTIFALLASSPAAAQSSLPPLPVPDAPASNDFDARLDQVFNGVSASPVESAVPAVEAVAADEVPATVTLEPVETLSPVPSLPPPSASQAPTLHVTDDIFGDEEATGGEIRWRYFNEHGRLRPGDPRQQNTYQQWRVLIDTALQTEIFEFRATYIDASNFGEELPRTVFDENRSDLLQLYGDLQLVLEGELESRIRVGRQLLDYGSQRMISRLDWANTERNFEGARFYTSWSDSFIDAFVSRPVNSAAGSPLRSRSFDHADQSAMFSGLYGSTKSESLGELDLYWLFLDETEPQITRLDGSVHTIGGRWNLEVPTEQDGWSATWLFELEGAGQFGEDNFVAGGNGQEVTAGAISVVGGTRLGTDENSLTLTGFCWVGSGDGDATDRRINTWHILYPDSHGYWGLIDNLSGSNLTDLGLRAEFAPVADVTFDLQWHRFHKTRTGDFVYDVQGLPIPGSASTPGDIGSELDLSLILGKSTDSSLQIGYFWFWYGDAINANPALSRPDAGQLYVSLSSRF
ncbi:hypothetical protein Pan44_42270 [Caulifigura coniformis]|uniref:Alginate export domain-containing protein n=1 Tax=Caulifigura coniformis TaxID=2527983 RepID=A0A517SJ83_9PLAN|nr:alginate export family protein [Caulifigura coniformis]QDT56175.1 hypothetical protein Pan44_42270 [Caulifigura coniformis]